MNFLIDTSIVSRLMRRPAAIDELLKQLRPTDQVFMSVISEGEIEFGLLNAGVPQDARLRDALDEAMMAFSGVIDVTRAAALRFAEVKNSLVKSGRTISENDMWIAAAAMANDMTLIHRDHGFTFVPGLRQQEWSHLA